MRRAPMGERFRHQAQAAIVAACEQDCRLGTDGGSPHELPPHESGRHARITCGGFYRGRQTGE